MSLLDMSPKVQSEILDVMKKENRTLLDAESIVAMRAINSLKPKVKNGYNV